LAEFNFRQLSKPPIIEGDFTLLAIQKNTEDVLLWNFRARGTVRDRLEEARHPYLFLQKAGRVDSMSLSWPS
jgi:hypothetical protein